MTDTALSALGARQPGPRTPLKPKEGENTLGLGASASESAPGRTALEFWRSAAQATAGVPAAFAALGKEKVLKHAAARRLWYSAAGSGTASPGDSTSSCRDFASIAELLIEAARQPDGGNEGADLGGRHRRGPRAVFQELEGVTPSSAAQGRPCPTQQSTFRHKLRQAPHLRVQGGSLDAELGPAGSKRHSSTHTVTFIPPQLEVILQVLADAGQGMKAGHVGLFQAARCSDAALQEKLRGAQCPGTQSHFPGTYHVLLASTTGPDPHHAAAIQNQLLSLVSQQFLHTMAFRLPARFRHGLYRLAKSGIRST